MSPEKTQNPQKLEAGERPAPVCGTLGVLLLHGFTSDLSCVSGLVPYLDEASIPYEMPVLRGHGGVPEDLMGVTHEMWRDDAAAALDRLSSCVDSIIVVGLSMGGLVTLDLCSAPSRNPKIVACVTWAAALDFVNPLSGLVRPLSRIFKMWKGQDSFRDPECRKKCTNYPRFPTSAFASLYDYARIMRGNMQNVDVPLCAIHSKRDQVIPFNMSYRLFISCRSPYRRLVVLQHSGHELGMDCEARTVFEETMDFIRLFLRPQATRSK